MTDQTISANDETPQIDLSLVVNIHDGTRYLNRTMRSIEDAARYASSYGIKIELLFVMDRSPPEAISWVEAYRSHVFHARNVLVVDNGSLGLSRNDGMAAAKGEIVLFADEDDLISYNMISEFYFLAKAGGPRNVVAPEYFLAFGNRHYSYRYFGSGVYSPLLFIADHPFTSRVCVHKSVLRVARYLDVRLSKGFAYEDYHFNSQLAALGFTFSVAPNTIVFYREKPQSLLQSMRSISTRQIPPTPLFEPSTYLAACAADYLRRDELEEIHRRERPTMQDFFTNPLCLELARAANEIDPGIDISQARHGLGGSNLGIPLGPGLAYYQACKNVGRTTFTDVVLFPFITKGGGEKYILTVLDAIEKIDPDARFLILAGELFKRHAWLDQLPKNAIFLDLPSLHGNLTADHIDILTLRLITSTAPHARLHLKTSPYSHRFIEKYGNLLTGNNLIYYRFCDSVSEINDAQFTQGFSFNFLSEHIDRMSCVVTDHNRIFEHDTSRLDAGAEKWKLLYTMVSPAVTPEQIEQRPDVFTHKLLWTSRLDRQKRPDLLCSIAERLRSSHPSISIHVFGSPTLDAFDVTKFNRHRNIQFHGEYDSFTSIPHQDFDALIYTSSFDGLPISVLDALSAGLPVIAPDLGGIGEVVLDGETGVLLHEIGEAALIDEYVKAVSMLYSDRRKYMRLRRNALELVERRHSQSAFLQRVAEILDLEAQSGKQKWQ